MEKISKNDMCNVSGGISFWCGLGIAGMVGACLTPLGWAASASIVTDLILMNASLALSAGDIIAFCG